MPIIVALLGLILIGGGMYFFATSNSNDVTGTVNSQTESAAIRAPEEQEAEAVAPGVIAADAEVVTPPVVDTEVEAAVRNSYTKTVSYLTPARTTHEMDVQLTLENSIVTAATITYDGGAGYSNPHQERFDAAYTTQVIGKRIEDISLSRVGGASLTSAAFNEAVAEIRTEARS